MIIGQSMGTGIFSLAEGRQEELPRGLLPYNWLQKPRDKEGVGGGGIVAIIVSSVRFLCKLCCYLRGETFFE